MSGGVLFFWNFVSYHPKSFTFSPASLSPQQHPSPVVVQILREKQSKYFGRQNLPSALCSTFSLSCGLLKVVKPGISTWSVTQPARDVLQFCEWIRFTKCLQQSLAQSQLFLFYFIFLTKSTLNKWKLLSSIYWWALFLRFSVDKVVTWLPKVPC